MRSAWRLCDVSFASTGRPSQRPTGCATAKCCGCSRFRRWKPSWLSTSCGWQPRQRPRSRPPPWWSPQLVRSGTGGRDHEGQARQSPSTSSRPTRGKSSGTSGWSVGCTAEDLSGTRGSRRRRKQAQGTVYATERLDQEQEWLCARGGRWIPSQAACVGHQSIHRGPDEKLRRGLAVPDMSDRVPFAGAAAATLAMWSTPLRTGSPRWRAADAPRGRS